MCGGDNDLTFNGHCRGSFAFLDLNWTKNETWNLMEKIQHRKKQYQFNFAGNFIHIKSLRNFEIDRPQT